MLSPEHTCQWTLKRRQAYQTMMGACLKRVEEPALWCENFETQSSSLWLWSSNQAMHSERSLRSTCHREHCCTESGCSLQVERGRDGGNLSTHSPSNIDWHLHCQAMGPVPLSLVLVKDHGLPVQIAELITVAKVKKMMMWMMKKMMLDLTFIRQCLLEGPEVWRMCAGVCLSNRLCTWHSKYCQKKRTLNTFELLSLDLEHVYHSIAQLWKVAIIEKSFSPQHLKLISVLCLVRQGSPEALKVF